MLSKFHEMRYSKNILTLTMLYYTILYFTMTFHRKRFPSVSIPLFRDVNNIHLSHILSHPPVSYPLSSNAMLTYLQRYPISSQIILSHLTPPYHTLPYPTTPHHTTPYHITPHHTTGYSGSQR